MYLRPLILFIFFLTVMGCNTTKQKSVTAEDILGDPEYLALSYGGYRHETRDIQPTLDELKEDMKLLAAMGVKLIRTYNAKLPQASNVLQAITELKTEDSDFEMYVMLGAWIDCHNAWTGQPVDHNRESEENAAEIDRVVALANQYPDIVKVIAVGNEAMVHWAESYYVHPRFILKWVKHLQKLKQEGGLPKNLWITSSDDFSSWGGGDTSYHINELEELIKAVDYISMHTYPMHNTYYNPHFWTLNGEHQSMSDFEKIDAAMQSALKFAQNQYQAVKGYMESIGVHKPIHIGETGWATLSDGHYGPNQSRAADEYKAGLYYQLMREWTNREGISCFYFEAFDEPWKDAKNPQGSENHFGLMGIDGQAKYALWDLVDQGVFEGLSRNGHKITKTYEGNKKALFDNVLIPPNTNEFKGFPN